MIDSSEKIPEPSLTANCPAGQTEQTVEFRDGANLPGSHCEHTDWPGALAYLPTLHALQAVILAKFEKYPDGLVGGMHMRGDGRRRRRAEQKETVSASNDIALNKPQGFHRKDAKERMGVQH